MNSKDRFYIIDLFDFYYCLLTNKQQSYFNMYFFEDKSLNEIAIIHSISKNAIYDSINHIINLLYDYESKLHLKEKYDKRIKIINKIQDNKIKNELINIEEI